MSNINTGGHLYRKRTVRRLSGQIIDMQDDTNGGVIISKGNIVNQGYMDELNKKEEDRRIAAQAITQQAQAPTSAPDRTIAPAQVSKINDLEKRIDSQDAKLDAILAALSKK